MRRLLLLVVIIGLVPETTFARRTPKQSVLRKVESLAKQGAIEFDKGNYEKALKAYSTAHELYQDPRLTFAMVRCLEALGRYQEALDMVHQGMAENPDRTLMARFKSKESFLLSKLKTGSLNLLIDPSDATVKVDGKVVGKSPLGTLQLSRGSHTIEISKKGYATVTQSVQIKGGDTIKLKISLQPIVGFVNVTSTPSGADVYVDGRLRAKTPANHLELSVGTHLIEVRGNGMKPISRTVSVSPNRTISIDVVLSRTTASLKKGPWYKSWPGWTVLGIGLVSGITGGVLLYKASRDHDLVRNQIDAVKNGGLPEYSQQQLVDIWDSANNKEKAGYALIVVGGTAAVTSAILFVTKVGVPVKKTKTIPMVMFGPHGYGFGVRGSF